MQLNSIQKCQKEFIDFLDYASKAITHFSISTMRTSQDNWPLDITIDTIVKSIVSLPNLENLSLDCQYPNFYGAFLSAVETSGFHPKELKIRLSCPSLCSKAIAFLSSTALMHTKIGLHYSFAWRVSESDLVKASMHLSMLLAALRPASQVQELRIAYCPQEIKKQCGESLRMFLCDNEFLETLSLSGDFSSNVITELVTGLNQNRSVKQFIFASHRSNDLSQIIGALTEPSSQGPCVQEFQLTCHDDPKESQVNHWAPRRLVTSPSCNLRKLKLRGFNASHMVPVLRALPCCHPKLESLEIEDTVVQGDNPLQVMDAFISVLPKSGNFPNLKQLVISEAVEDLDFEDEPNDALDVALLEKWKELKPKLLQSLKNNNIHLEQVELAAIDSAGSTEDESFERDLKSVCTRNKAAKLATALTTGTLPWSSFPEIVETIMKDSTEEDLTNGTLELVWIEHLQTVLIPFLTRHGGGRIV
ncbi:expressed unknown protein [Seminavis robusta]|uniref:Uncharacterized protein n=1 Tax=Seminavis robusta TaxID=568900 RepID=A0A9N8DXY4_9STRA|nr:expressed unknown protein [Seminavis robusta]|eukprot:Sro434_g141990.1 n/a (475) ;mRNA; f:15998-17422